MPRAMSLGDYVSIHRISTALTSDTKSTVLREMSALLTVDAPHLDVDAVVGVLEAREALASTGVGSGVAIPHGRLAGLTEVRAAFGVARDGVPFEAIDGEPVTLIVAVLAPEDQQSKHLRVLADASRVLRRDSFRRALVAAERPEQALALLQQSA